MGLTFSLTSFACMGPFVGPLLVASVQGSGLQPVLGMASSPSGLAAPFFLLALFPAYLKRLPKSGGWLVRVKVVLGFVVLAAALKYLSTSTRSCNRPDYARTVPGLLVVCSRCPAFTCWAFCVWKESSRRTARASAACIRRRYS